VTNLEKGNEFAWEKTTHAVCPVRALVKYLARRGGTSGPLFVWPNNKALKKASFSTRPFKSYIWILTTLTRIALGLVLPRQQNKLV